MTGEDHNWRFWEGASARMITLLQGYSGSKNSVDSFSRKQFCIEINRRELINFSTCLLLLLGEEEGPEVGDRQRFGSGLNDSEFVEGVN